MLTFPYVKLARTYIKENILEKIAVYRNLNKAKQNKEIYIFSIANVNSARTRGKVIEYTDESKYNDTMLQLSNVYDVCQLGTLERIQKNSTREVGAWVVGNPSITNALPTNARRITMNPLIGDRCFKYADNREDVNFQEIDTVTFNKQGCFVN